MWRDAIEPPLAGREAEARVLGELLDELDRGRSGLTLEVAGEPGIGKSRLLRELLGQARGRGHRVFSSRAAELENGQPFGVVSDAVDDWLLAHPHEGLEALAGGLATELAVVLPAFESLSRREAPELLQERYRSYRAVRLLLAAIAAAEGAPVVVALDDVQWADPGSLELLAHLLTHPCAAPVLLALAFRPAQVPPRLAVALAAAVREPGGRRLELTRLGSVAARQLLGAEVSLPVGERLYRESGGNPFFLLQLARADARAGLRRAPSLDVGSLLPETVRAALTSELSALPAPARVLLEGAAVSGDPFDLRIAAAAAGVAEADELIGELLRFALVHPVSAGGHFAFRHPIVRTIVYQLAADGWRVRAHARAAAFLAASGASAAARAPHVERSAIRGDDEAIALLVAAGTASASRAPALAARWYAAALRLLTDTPAAQGRRIELLIALATALAGDGQLDQSRAALCEILDLLPDAHPERVAVVAFCAGVEHLLGRHRDADARLTAAHRLVAGSGAVEAVLLELELAAGAGYQNRDEEMLRWAERALAGARALALPAPAAAAAGQVALARYFLGLPAGEAIDAAARQLDDLTDAELAGRLDLGLWVGWTESVLERHDRAIAHCRRVVDVSRATGQGATLLVTMTAQAWSLLRSGHLDAAEEVLGAAIETGRLAPHLFLSVAEGLSASLATLRGQLAEAVRAGEESVRLARSADPGLIPGMSGVFLAIPLIELGEAQRARDILLEMSGGRELRTSRSGHTAAYEILTRAELALGHPEAAEDWARAAEQATHGEQLPIEAAFAHRARAVVLLAGGDPGAAGALALRAAARAEAAGAPVEAGRCRIVAAHALHRAGRRGEAATELELAAEELTRAGAHGYRAEAERALRRLGRRTARRPLSPADGGDGLESLSEREREIAERVGRGHTNREIAAALFLSEKTVERHLARMFAKLGVARRAELAARVAGERDPRT